MKLFDFDSGSRPTALIILFPVGVKGLFNPAVHSLVREVQEQLDDVYVSYALSSGAPSVADAIAASRFAGCSSAVVVHASDHASDADLGSPGERFHGDSPIQGSLELVDLTPASVVGAYQSAVAGAHRAA